MSKSPVIEVDVKGHHIENGKRGKCAECPIALAIREAYPDLMVSVGIGDCHVGHFRYDLPVEATVFIRRFDFNSAPVSPIKFRLSNPKPSTFWL